MRQVFGQFGKFLPPRWGRRQVKLAAQAIALLIKGYGMTFFPGGKRCAHTGRPAADDHDLLRHCCFFNCALLLTSCFGIAEAFNGF